LYNDWYIDPTDNVEKPMIPDGAVIMSGADLMGTRAFGVILDPEFNYGPLAYAPKSGLKKPSTTSHPDAVRAAGYPKPCECIALRHGGLIWLKKRNLRSWMT
jgi:hypothetical protein